MRSADKYIHQIDWPKAMERLVFSYRQQEQHESWWTILKFFMGLFFLRFMIPKVQATQFLFFKTMERGDYDKLFEAVYLQCPSPNQLVIPKLDYQWMLNTKIFSLLLRFSSLPQGVTAGSMKERIYLYTNYLRIVEILDGLGALEVEHLIVFADMQPMDNALAQLFKQKGINTITLQHGLYADLRDTDDMNVVNCKNTVSHHFLAWGEATQELLLVYGKNVETTICGKPLPLAIDINAPAKDYATIILDHPLYTAKNKELLQMARALSTKQGLKINVRLHPYDNPSGYDLSGDNVLVGEELDDSRFVLGHTSSLLYECMRAGMQTYKMRSDQPSPSTGRDEAFSFASLEELESKIAANYDAEATGKYYIQYTGEAAQEQYLQFFQSLIDPQI